MIGILSDICDYYKNTVDNELAELNSYVSTENMLPNKAGVVIANSLPKSGTVNTYDKGDVLVSNIRPYFKKIFLAERSGTCSNDVLVFRPKETVSSEYLYCVLQQDSFFSYATQTAKGTKMPRGDKKAILNFPIRIKTPQQQSKITNLVMPLEAKIRLNKWINDNLEQLAKSYFQKLFIDNAHSNWTLGTISDLGTIVGGGTPSKSKPEYYSSNGVAWITPKDLSINKSKFISHGANDITELGLKNSSACVMPEGTVLFSSRAPIGYIAIASGKVTTNQGFKSVVPKPEIGTAFVYYFLKHNLPVIEAMASGSTFKEVSGSIMRNVPVVIPDAETLAKFSEFCGSIFLQQKILEEQNQSLANLRDTLLHKCMSGTLDVSKLNI